ncbi:MAG: YaaL family protein [Halanaerobiales bacterium]|nr:YaaL family protein [Halanaerobiales bacterium]
MIQTITSKVKEWIDFDETVLWTDFRVDKNNLLNEITDAKNEWVQAQTYFQNVIDPDLIDHAIYLLEAAEAKYSYLLKQARDSSSSHTIIVKDQL